jgi:Sec-independent protein translocase protein TatA/RNA polymerase subunit RPABC4/transcription elongation factor Spt4
MHMYCKKCGCRLSSSAKVCPECGCEATTEYCGGFWGIVGENSKVPAPHERDAAPQKKTTAAAPAAPPATASEETLKELAAARKEASERKAIAAKERARADKAEEKLRSRGKTLAIILVLVLLFGLLQSLRLAGRPTNKDISDLKDQVKTLEDQNKTLDKQNRELQKTNDTLQKENDELKKQLEYPQDHSGGLFGNGTDHNPYNAPDGGQYYNNWGGDSDGQ